MLIVQQPYQYAAYEASMDRMMMYEARNRLKGFEADCLRSLGSVEIVGMKNGVTFRMLDFDWWPASQSTGAGPCLCLNLSSDSADTTDEEETGVYTSITWPDIAQGKLVHEARLYHFSKIKLRFQPRQLGVLSTLAVQCGLWLLPWNAELVKWKREAITCGVVAQLVKSGAVREPMTDSQWRSTVRSEFTRQVDLPRKGVDALVTAIRAHGKKPEDVAGAQNLRMLHETPMRIWDVRAVWPWTPYPKYKPTDITLNFIAAAMKGCDEAKVKSLVSSMYPTAGLLQDWYGRYKLEEMGWSDDDYMDFADFGDTDLGGVNCWLLVKDATKPGCLVLRVSSVEEAEKLANSMKKKRNWLEFRVTRDLKPARST